MEYGGFMGRNNFKTFEASLDSVPMMESGVIYAFGQWVSFRRAQENYAEACVEDANIA
jgi:hypothetical protein